MNRPVTPDIQRGVEPLKTAKTYTSAPSTGAAVIYNVNSQRSSHHIPESGNVVVMADTYKEFSSDTSPIVPEIKIRSMSFRVREIVLASISLVAFIVCLVLIALVATNRRQSGDLNISGVTAAQTALRSLCTDAPCLKAAAYAVAYMNTSVNPCENFYQYACGNFPALNPLDADTNQRTIFWNLYYENENKLRTLLEAPPTRNSAWSAEKKLKDFFMSCIDDYGKMRVGGRAFIEKIIQPLGGWDVIGTFRADTFDLNTWLQKTSIDFWTAALFTFRVVNDEVDPENRVIEIDMAGMGMGWPYYTLPTAEQVRQHYRKFIRSVAQLLARDSGLSQDPAQLSTKIDNFVNDVFEIEFQLANITANTQPSSDPHNHENRISLTELNTQTNNVVDFVAFLRYMFGSTNVNGNTRVIVQEYDWIRRMLEMVANLPAENKTRMLSNYFIWRCARTYAQEISYEYTHLNRIFSDDVTGNQNFWGTWHHCFYHANRDMPDALGSLYAKQHFNDKNKDKAEEIVQYIKEQLIAAVDSNKFLDDPTKEKAKTKLKASTDKMGYPDIYLNDADIDNIYQDIAINRSDYFQNLLNLNAFEKADWTRRLTKREDKSRWLYNSYDTSMTFFNSWNQLLVPAGMLQFPVYEWTLPHYFNFGSMGSLVGHYIVHAIDNWGGNYDEHGVYGSWYTNASKVAYTKVEECFANAYMNKTMGPFQLSEQSPPQTVLTNGARFAWEGLAETSGVRLAYKAYKKWVADKGEERPTPLPHYTNDQSFFLSYAQTNCYNRADKLGFNYANRQRISEDIRVNTALSLLEEFTSTFQCPEGSKMRTQMSCDMYG